MAQTLRPASATILEGDKDCLLAIAAARVGTWRWYLESDTISLSPRASELIGTSSSSLDYTAFVAQLHPEDRGITDRSLCHCLETGEQLDFDFRTLPADGKGQWLHMRGQVFSEDGRPVEARGILIDIVRRKISEEANSRLAAIVASSDDATASKVTERQEAQQRLQDLQAELVHMSRFTAMGEMASTLAHELNQPLTAVVNYLKGGRRLLDSEQTENIPMAREAVERAAEQALRAGQIIRRLCEFVTRGETDLQVQNLAKMIEEAGALALVGNRETGVRVSFAFDPRVEFVLADRIQVQQVLLNLMRNAIEAMQETVRRELAVSTHCLDNGTVQVDVADTGPGLATEIANQLFQPFITSKRNGMGVGLSISRTIIEAHGGRIWAEPNPNGGAIFRLTLRMIAKEDLADGN